MSDLIAASGCGKSVLEDDYQLDADSVQIMPRRTVSMSMSLSWAIDDAATSFAALIEAT